MNKEKFKEFLENKVKPAVQRLRIGQPVLLFDNATPHNNDLIKKTLHDLDWLRLPHPPYSPDLNPW
jgi:transposase